MFWHKETMSAPGGDTVMPLDDPRLLKLGNDILALGLPANGVAPCSGCQERHCVRPHMDVHWRHINILVWSDFNGEGQGVILLEVTGE